jgi:excisionase family DNA binding protein
MLIINQIDTVEELEGVIRKLLKENINTEPQPSGEELLTIQEAANLLHLSVPTVYGLVHRKEVPVCKKGKRLYFPKQELVEWIKSGRKQTVKELTEEAVAEFQVANKRR